MTKEEVFAKAEAIGALTTITEKEALWMLANKYIQEGGTALEVGTWTGGSAVIIGEVCKQKNARLVCVDAFSADMHSAGTGIRVDALQSVLNNCPDLPIDYMVGDSVNFIPYLKDGSFDFIFIDGDHHFPKVTQDILGYYTKVREGGGYLIHDYGNPCDVKAVVDEFFSEERLTHYESAVFMEKR